MESHKRAFICTTIKGLCLGPVRELWLKQALQAYVEGTWDEKANEEARMVFLKKAFADVLVKKGVTLNMADMLVAKEMFRQAYVCIVRGPRDGISTEGYHSGPTSPFKVCKRPGCLLYESDVRMCGYIHKDELFAADKAAAVVAVVANHYYTYDVVFFMKKEGDPMVFAFPVLSGLPRPPLTMEHVSSTGFCSCQAFTPVSPKGGYGNIRDIDLWRVLFIAENPEVYLQELGTLKALDQASDVQLARFGEKETYPSLTKWAISRFCKEGKSTVDDPVLEVVTNAALVLGPSGMDDLLEAAGEAVQRHGLHGVNMLCAVYTHAFSHEIHPTHIIADLRYYNIKTEVLDRCHYNQGWSSNLYRVTEVLDWLHSVGRIVPYGRDRGVEALYELVRDSSSQQEVVTSVLNCFEPDISISKEEMQQHMA